MTKDDRGFYLYRGYTIKCIHYQGSMNYIVPLLGKDIACNLQTAKKWIDCHIQEKVGVNMDNTTMPKCCICGRQFTMWEKVKVYNGFDHCVDCFDRIFPDREDEAKDDREAL